MIRSFARQGWRYLIVLVVIALAFRLGQRGTARTLVLLVAIGILFLLARDLRRGLVALPAACLLIPFQIGTGTDVSLSSPVLAVPVLAVLWLVRRLFEGRVSVVHSRLNYPLLVFLVAMTLSLFLGNALWDETVPRPSNLILVQLGQISIYVLSFVSFWLMANLVTGPDWVRRVAYAFVITGGIAISVLFFLGGSSVARLIFPGDNLPNLVGVWVVALSLSLFFCDEQLTSRQRVALLLTLALTLAWLWLFQRDWYGAWAPPMAAIGVILWWRFPRLRVLLALGAILFVVIYTGTSDSGFAVGTSDSGFEDSLDVAGEWEESGATRLTLWRSVLELGSRRPVLGLGIAAYRHYHFLKPLTHLHLTWMTPNVSAHNQFIDLFAQMGLVGVACYLWFLVETVLVTMRLYAKSKGFAQGYALAVLGALAGTWMADMVAATSLPFVYNVGFKGLPGSVLGWMLLGGLVVLENSDVGCSDKPHNGGNDFGGTQ